MSRLSTLYAACFVMVSVWARILSNGFSLTVLQSHGKLQAQLMADKVPGLELPYKEASSIYVHYLGSMMGLY